MTEEKKKLEFYQDLPPNKSNAMKQIERIQNEIVCFNFFFYLKNMHLIVTVNKKTETKRSRNREKIRHS